MALEVWDCHRFGDPCESSCVLVSTTTATVLTPILCHQEQATECGFDNAEQMLEAFLVWVPVDPRKYVFNELATKWGEFITHRETRNDPEF